MTGLRVTGSEYAQVDPVFGNAFETIVRCKNHGRISDPGAYVRTLTDHFVAQGGALQIATINDLEMEGISISALLTDEGRLSADKIVFALLAPLDINTLA